MINKSNVKILAYFLPQFHSIPENDEWWGKDFTEWTNVKKENSISKNLLPLNNNYYNLLDESTVIWQTELAEKYGVYGFAYYHYYFCGRKLLEKPAENLLNNKNINQNFCFCWANHDWIRSWEGKKTILVKQEYGGEAEWKAHFNYLLPFFKDDRYIKINNKPLFVVFLEFEEKNAVHEYFNILAKENGFDGIFFAQSIPNYKKNILLNSVNSSDAIIIREPDASFRRFFKFEKLLTLIKKILFRSDNPFKIKKYSSSLLSKLIVKNAFYFCNLMRSTNIKYFLGAYTGWDNTARHGKRGYRVTPISDKNYINYLSKLRRIAEKENIEFIFFNAWNEWAEGMIMEPDIYNNYRYLEGIRQVFKNE